MNPQRLRRTIRAALRNAAAPDKAAPMQAYMKSKMPFLGVQKGPRTHALRPVFQDLNLGTPQQYTALLVELWDGAKYREERYATLALARDRTTKPLRAALKVQAMPVYEHFIVTGAWWDFVDETAIKLVGPLLGDHPSRMKPLLRRWSKDEDLWRRRTSIIAQVGRRKVCDDELLFACIEPNLDDSEFFIRKAIGWALRDRAWEAPELVVDYVRQNQAQLSPLSRREALKNIHRLL